MSQEITYRLTIGLGTFNVDMDIPESELKAPHFYGAYVYPATQRLKLEKAKLDGSV